LNLSAEDLFLTNVNKNIGQIWVSVGTLKSSGGTSMAMDLGGNSFFQNFGTDVTAMGNQRAVQDVLVTTTDYSMRGYISAPFFPSYGLYVFTFYFNSPRNPAKYSSLVVRRYFQTGVSP
jgi:hypothetical protein